MYIGYRVGEYTSPGMLTDRENIRLNGKIISQANYVKYHQICMSYAKQIYTKNIKMLGANSVISNIFIFITIDAILHGITIFYKE